MKMNREKAKSIVLALLVFLSLILSWGLWTFQPQYDFRHKNNPIQTVTIGEKRQFNEVIKPLQFMYHQGGLHYQLSDYVLANKVYEAVMNLNVVNYEHITFSSKEQRESILFRESSLELIYPVNLPINIVNYIMKPVRQEWNLNYFDRIVVNFSKSPAIYFVSSSLDQAIKLNIEDSEINNIKEQLATGVIEVSGSPYFTIRGNHGQILYLPEKRVTVKQLTFSTENIPSTDFKNALFSDPNGVKQYSLNNGEESFTDGTRALAISKNQGMMNFINPANPEVYELDSEEMILKSIEFINDHSGWTDSFSLMDWSKTNHTVSFRLMVGGSPVFSQNESTSINESWRDNEIYEYTRSLTNLRFSITNEQKTVILPSGRELLSYLTQMKPKFSLNSLEAALIGYDFVKENKKTSMMATVRPIWYIKYDGKWEEIVIPSTSKGQGGS
ncbi:YycH family regulatory protein [Schinkia sp. CFF1]